MMKRKILLLLLGCCQIEHSSCQVSNLRGSNSSSSSSLSSLFSSPLSLRSSEVHNENVDIDNVTSGNQHNNSFSDSAETKSDFHFTWRTRKLKAKSIKPYTLWSSGKIHNTVNEWAGIYPDLLRVTTSQKEYGLPTAGRADDCKSDGQEGCVNYILTIQDFVAHPKGSKSASRLPSVLLSGTLHGDERTGPTGVLETAHVLLEAASCEALPNRAVYKKRSSKAWKKEVAKAKTCRQNLYEKGITDEQRLWLTRLVSTRKIVIVPTANALGYDRNTREEDGIDPNRDFPYDLNDDNCMNSIAARTLNEVFLDSLFQLSLTFHGGMEVITYEWGSFSWVPFLSPDDTAQREISALYSNFGGGWAKSKPYVYGDSNLKTYPIRGGMEDWAYAASWDFPRVPVCRPRKKRELPIVEDQLQRKCLETFQYLD